MKFSLQEISFRYKLALFLIALLSILAYLNLSTLIQEQSKYAEIINISGRQRMLSQQIALFAIYYKMNDLKRTIYQMENNHFFLTHLPNLPKNVKKLFFQKPTQLDRQVKLYLENARRFIETKSGIYLSYILQHSQKILQDLDRVVNEFQKESELKTRELETRERYILLLTLITLLLEALFIFRPAVEKIREYLHTILQEKRLQDAIVESSPVGLIAIDEGENIQVYNTSAKRIFHYTFEELKNFGLEAIIPENLYEQHKKGFENFLKTGKLKNRGAIVTEGKKKDGTIFPIRVNFGVANLGKEKVIIANIEDITQEKEKDRLLLQQSRNAAMGEMIGNIAHQWR